jgi:hypothetical protein
MNHNPTDPTAVHSPNNLPLRWPLAILPLGVWLSLAGFVGAAVPESTIDLAASFANPPASARPGAYWYFMDGNQDRAAMTADLEAMHRAGMRKALFLEVNIGVPRGPVDFMSDAWQENFAHAVHTADRLGMEIILGTGPGWCGAGGPWIKPERSMQHLCASSLEVSGPGPFAGKLPVPEPRKPSPFAGLSPALAAERQRWHADVAVLAFPTPAKTEPPDLLDVKALYDTQPYSSWKHVPRFVPTQAAYPEPPAAAVVDPEKIVDLTGALRPDGTLDWQVPAGNWTVMRFAARSTGVTSRPAPDPGHGFESDKFSAEAFQYHFEQFHRKLMDKVGPRQPGRGWTALHLDSWESSSQNWTAGFRKEFQQRRGYDPQPFFPAYNGLIVGSRETTERFLWDLRKTAQELVIENHAGAIRRLAHDNGFYFTSQFYDMNPAGDLDLGAVADIPSCEFWSGENDTVYSCVEAVAVAHTMGRPVVRAEAFTSNPKHGYADNPADMKNRTDWAFALGINDFIIHTYQHQPLGLDGPKPGMAMGPHGIHWHRNQTFWPMVGPYHDYLARCGYLLGQGVSVAEILYLVPEGAPHIFLPPEDAMLGDGLLREKKGHGFDAVSAGILIARAKAEHGRIAFPGGTSYRVLVLPASATMTPELLGKIAQLVRAGITVIGTPPVKSPSLTAHPQCDEQVRALANDLWGGPNTPAAVTEHPCGQGRIVWGGNSTAPASADKLYPSYASTVAWLEAQGVGPNFASTGPLRHHQRRTENLDLFFVANREGRPVEARCTFRTDGAAPELWNPVTGERHSLPQFALLNDTAELPLRLAPFEAAFVVFDRKANRAAAAPGGKNAPAERIVATLDGAYRVTFGPAWGGPPQAVTFDPLTTWNTSTEEGIRYYSGEAVYQKSFGRPAGAKEGERLFLDLGVVHKLARVKLNGHDLGIVWTPPFRVEITGKLQPTNNLVEITVANTWVNRLIGDQQPAYKGVRQLQWESGLLGGKPQPAGRFTFTTAMDYTADSPLQESGLLGPVTIQSTERPAP